jgi:1-acyl-sn-glycerol-3-phosphate acyltransferase
MQNVVIVDRPYKFVPPRHGRFWPKLFSWYAARMLRKDYRIRHIEYRGLENLKASIAAGHGVLIAANHPRDEDALLMFDLCRRIGTPIYLMFSWHVLHQDRIQKFFLPRVGGFSIWREGPDRAAISTAVELLAQARRPLGIAPEGYVTRTNDRLVEFAEGISLVARSAAKARAKQNPPGKVVVQPMAIRYTFGGNVDSAVAGVLDEIDAKFGWESKRDIPILDRLCRTGLSLLATKEKEHFGSEQTGSLAERLSSFMEHLVRPIEDEWVGGKRDGSIPTRVQRVRVAIVPEMCQGNVSDVERARRRKQLGDLNLALQLHRYPPDYLEGNPRPERILETAEKFLEDVTDKLKPLGALRTTVTFGPAIEVNPQRESRQGPDPLLAEIDRAISEMLGLHGD